MKTDIPPDKLERYDTDGFLVLEGFLTHEELSAWRHAVDQAVHDFEANRSTPADISESQQYYRDVFTQCVNLWKTNPAVRDLVLDPRLGKVASTVARTSGVRLYHDHALIKQPWANATNFHIDNPYDPFDSERAIMLWIALDDATVQNGCLYLLPGTHKESRFDFGGDLSQASVGDLFREYPEWADIDPYTAEMQAGDVIFISGLVAHAAGPNMTTRPRRALSILYMPEDAVFNGRKSALPDEVYERLKEGDLLEDAEHLPLIYTSGQES